MKRCVWVFGLAVAVAGCKGKPAGSGGSGAVSPAVTRSAPSTAAASSSMATSSTQPSDSSKVGPRWDWQQYDKESFETEPSQGRVFSIPENATRLRVKLTASLPVDAATMTREVFKSAKGVVREDRLVRLPCASIGVRQDDAKCALDTKEPAVYVVRDRRALPGDPAAMEALRQRAGGRLPGMPADKIQVVLSVWACVANCGPLGGPAQ